MTTLYYLHWGLVKLLVTSTREPSTGILDPTLHSDVLAPATGRGNTKIIAGRGATKIIKGSS